ncbi:MAG: hypothetical protein JSW61_03955 [Candidatus Thorarchaeota archaeon]|nr:MAG: hypothetical protein JSW61_03955 [Candidatus Thorarchaeota archaeon]
MNPYESEYIDLHQELLPYDEVLRHLRLIEDSGNLERYFKGANRGGRWFFQILSEEFVETLASMINSLNKISQNPGPVLEVMSGDGRLTEFLVSRAERRIIATDSKDGRYNIAYPKWVETMDALEAVEHYNPAFVVLSWEPYLSDVGCRIVEAGIPTAWIGQVKKCGHPDLFELEHKKTNNQYVLGKFDSFLRNELHSDVYLFNC